MVVVLSSDCLFFKQKTAYEMRISDWSSDVCSSDLASVLAAVAWACSIWASSSGSCEAAWPGSMRSTGSPFFTCSPSGTKNRITTRSEEHTSELQSLMRISYAVFCLKKKKTHKSDARTSTTHIVYYH